MLEIGSKIPDLTGKDKDGKSIPLREYSDKYLVIYFYPKDDTPGCTAQACSIRDMHQALLSKEIIVLGISADAENAHAKFSNKFQLPFTLISDTEKSIINAFGVWGPKKFMGRNYEGIHRTTFLFDKSGILIHIITKPDTKQHAQEILNFYQNFKERN